MNTWKIVNFVILSISVQISIAQTDQCQAFIQLTHFTPNICYYDSDRPDCVDQCSTASPAAVPSCFNTLNLPCELKEDLFNSAASRQTLGEDTWIHISDLLSYPALLTDLHIIRKDLFDELYEGFIAPPSIDWIGATSTQIKKENFRLAMISEVKAILLPLKEAAVFKRLSLGRALEPGIAAEFDNIIMRVNEYPLFNQAEAGNLVSELNQLKRSELILWEFITQVEKALVKDSRLAYMNNLLNQLALNIDKLVEEERQYILSKAQDSELLANMNFRECETGICFDPIADPGDDFYNGLDQRLTLAEMYINLLLREAEALENTIGDDLNPAPPGSFPHPDFSGLMNANIEAYVANPSVENLKRLEAAVNIAFLQQGVDGNTLFDTLRQTAEAEIQGQSFLMAYEDKKTLLCHDLNRLDEELQMIVEESSQLANEATEIIQQMLEGEHTPELLAQLELIIYQLSELEIRSEKIATLDRFTPDRHINILWDLETIENAFDSSVLSIRVEFIAYDGMYWIPSASTPIMRLMPSIAEISTAKGSLLPSANGRISALKTVSLVLRQSPYDACSINNQQLRLAVAVTDEHDQSKRYILTSELDQL